MQKRKIVLVALVSIFSFEGLADEIKTASENAQVVPAPIQNHISRLMEDDVEFNQAQHQLAQQLTLAKLRLEMAKIKSEAAELTQTPLINTVNAGSANEETPPPATASFTEPRVMMLSQIAGITQAAVSVGTKTLFVHIGEIFPANGKRYAVHQDKHGHQPFVREVSR
ncbi:hypothetical protein [Rahnella aceris]|uniref:hypothetical protein n=1 Tax=Rahnella sp. (strain Y9602) TaxID=2703885 RepID=UPI001C2658FB|nr:hypothetical protein [Rahnella aceris]MBU9849078.1 hypothetical protein [Rahnella aceris]